ncbi:O-antigen ligase [Bosea sp. (in: a-proteobacteria)]|uniref:O-antigen ligase family protein n=1 Tax=Bosea sp. (in: a-proteobacteria) TaxID=1871050 RepID=UPI002619A772|nr:O-antigen ligase [Bosea sp. (in: a-proteobacteria)]MCO5093285.1 O-antigen ligase family protein [Bosea sp. (in: a-proteobacteria)]
MSDSVHGPTIGDSAPSAAFGGVLAGCGLFVLILSLQPFAAPPEATAPVESTGNIVNQIGWFGLGLVFLAALLCLTRRDVLARLGLGRWGLVFTIAALSALQALDPAASLRGLLLTGIVMIVVAGVLLLPRDEGAFATAAVNACLVLVLLIYAMLLLAPHLVVHSAEGAEGVHAGDWRGHLSHKNFAAPVFSIMAMIGIYGWQSRLRWRGALIVALCVVFVLNSGSKTTMGFLPLALGVVALARISGRPGLAVLVHLGLVGLIAALTVGSVMSPLLSGLVKVLIPDPTFTGRDEIWRFALNRIAERPWSGYGYASFWQTPVVTGLEENYEASWDVRGIGSAHNSYLDAALAFGIPGAVVTIVVLTGLPLLDYLAACRVAGNRRLADLFAMIVVFMTYVGMLESFLLNRADPLWVLFALAVTGLGLAGRMRARPP